MLGRGDENDNHKGRAQGDASAAHRHDIHSQIIEEIVHGDAVPFLQILFNDPGNLSDGNAVVAVPEPGIYLT